jgi:orotidine-5'-phosphate decarboxylase
VKGRPELVVALDVDTLEEAERWLDRLGGEVKWFKVGSRLYTRFGRSVADAVAKRGGKLFLDLKFHDIPWTVQGAAEAAFALGASMITVHAAGGREMVEAAVEGRRRAGREDGWIVAVTALTHLPPDHFRRLFGASRPLDELVAALVEEALSGGADGVVASVEELPRIRERFGSTPLVVTPGIRLPDGETDDQRRRGTPEAAVRRGADFLVVGRPILRAEDPVARLREFLRRMGR